MRIAWLTTLPVIVALSGVGCSDYGSGYEGASPAPRGSADTKVDTGEEEAFGPYRLDIPAGFKETGMAIPMPSDQVDLVARVWCGPGKWYGEPTIAMAYARLGLDLSQEEPTWEALADSSLNGLRMGCDSVSVKESKRLRVNGMAAVRCEGWGQTDGTIVIGGVRYAPARRLKRTDDSMMIGSELYARTRSDQEGRQEKKVEIRMVSYALIDHENVIVVTATEGGPDAESSVKRLEQSLLTLHRPDYEPSPKVAAISDRPNKTMSLREAREGFRTKLSPSSVESLPLEAPSHPFQFVEYESDVGKLGAYLTRDPRDGNQHPAIVWVTGYDCNSVGDVWSPSPAEYEESASAYRKAGIVMMFPSLRGGNNENPGQREGLFGEVDDVVAATEYLVGQSYVDPDRVYLGGHGSAGTLALLVSEYTDRFRAVFSIGPVKSTGDYLPMQLPFDYTNVREVELRAPILWLHSIKKPTFVFEAEVGNTNSLEALRTASDNELVRCFLVGGEDHQSVLAPLNQHIAAKIVQDNGPTCNLAFSDAELARLPNVAYEDPTWRNGFARQHESPFRTQRGFPHDTPAIGLDTSHPDYFKTNLDVLRSGTHFDRDDALDRLVNVQPADVADNPLKGEIARAMRDVAFDDRAGHNLRRKAVRGLVTWSGNYSVPLLLRLLDDRVPPVRDEVVVVLGELRDERAIEPLARRLATSPFGQDKITNSLRAFGPQAEDAVLQHASTDNPETLRCTLDLLADIGTSKSLPYLARLRSDRRFTFMLRDEIAAAITAIEHRADR